MLFRQDDPFKIIRHFLGLTKRAIAPGLRWGIGIFVLVYRLCCPVNRSSN